MKTLLRMLVLLAVLSPGVALAQDASAQAREHYKKGRVHYDLGRFDQAIVEFEKAFELTGAPELLFNLAQSHRMAGNKERALFFYRRYLSLSPNAPNKAEVQGRITELEQGMSEEQKRKADEEQKRKEDEARKLEEQKKADEARRLEEEKKGTSTEDAPVKPGGPAAVEGSAGTSAAGSVSARPSGPDVPRIFLGVDVGTSKVGFGGDYESQVPAQATLQLRGAYRWRFGTLFADAGALVSFTTLPFFMPDGTTKESSSLMGLVAGGAFGYAQPRWSVRLELGAGLLAWGGLKEGNPFTAQFPENDVQGRMGGLGADGTLGMFNFRVALVPEVVVWQKLSAAMTLAFQGASAPDGMHDTVDGVQRVELLFGLGYSL